MGILTLAPALKQRLGARIGVGLLAAFLPWLHQKYVFLVAGLMLALLLDRRRWRLWPWLVALPAAGFLGTVAFSEWIQGRGNFTQAGSADTVTGAFNLGLGRYLAQPFAWFFDQTRGYLPLAPVWVLAGVGLLFLLRFRRGRSMLAFLAVGFLPYFLVYFAGPFLAGDAPPGRETLPALPALAILLAAAYQALRGPLAVALAALLAVPSLYLGTKPAFSPGMDVFFNNVGQPKLLLYLSDGRFNVASLWPRITTDIGRWSYSVLMIDALAALFFVGTVFLSSRLVSLRSGGRPWALARGDEGRSWLVPEPP
jgi:hypothetical protein